MEDFPPDIVKTAINCAETVCRNLDYDDVSVEIREIAHVIRAERQRCADEIHAALGADPNLMEMAVQEALIRIQRGAS